MKRNNNELRAFVADFQQAARFHDDNYTDQANYDTRRQLFERAHGKHLQQIRDLEEYAATPVSTERLAKALITDYSAILVKWPQVEKLLEAGRGWDEIIDQADQHMLGAIVEHAETYFQAKDGDMAQTIRHHAAYGGDGKAPIADQLDDLYIKVARRGAKLGNNGAKNWLDDRAGRAYDAVLAEKMQKYVRGNKNSASVEALAEMWVREAETRAAQIQGVPTPNERDRAAQQAQRAREFEQQAQVKRQNRGYAPGESPDELAAKISRSGFSRHGYQ